MLKNVRQQVWRWHPSAIAIELMFLGIFALQMASTNTAGGSACHSMEHRNKRGGASIADGIRYHVHFLALL